MVRNGKGQVEWARRAILTWLGALLAVRSWADSAVPPCVRAVFAGTHPPQSAGPALETADTGGRGGGVTRGQ